MIQMKRNLKKNTDLTSYLYRNIKNINNNIYSNKITYDENSILRSLLNWKAPSQVF